MIDQSQTSPIPLFISPQLTVIPRQEMRPPQIFEGAGHHFGQPAGFNPPLVSRPQPQQRYQLTAGYPSPSRRIRQQGSNLYRNVVILIVAIVLGIMAGFLAPTLLNMFEESAFTWEEVEPYALHSEITPLAGEPSLADPREVSVYLDPAPGLDGDMTFGKDF